MVIFEVYSRNIKVTYKNTLLSKATCLKFITGVLSVIIPFVIAHKSGGFWHKREVFYEQPKVNLRGEYLFIATTSNPNFPLIVCSTYRFYIENVKRLDNCSLIKLREIDVDLDGKIDKLDLSLRLNIFQAEITSTMIILPVNYKLETVCPLQMQSALIHQYQCHEKITDLHIMADLTLHQSGPIFCHNRIHNTYDTPVVSDTGKSDDFELEHIIQEYLQRNVTTQLTNIFTNIRKENKNVFELKLSVRYLEVKVYYRPGLWQIVKTAWIQYFAIFVVVNWCLKSLQDFIFSKKMVLFYEESPLKKNM